MNRKLPISDVGGLSASAPAQDHRDCFPARGNTRSAIRQGRSCHAPLYDKRRRPSKGRSHAAALIGVRGKDFSRKFSVCVAHYEGLVGSLDDRGARIAAWRDHCPHRERRSPQHRAYNAGAGPVGLFDARMSPQNEPGRPGIDVCHAPRWLLSWHVAGVTGGASACRVRSRAGRICTSVLE